MRPARTVVLELAAFAALSWYAAAHWASGLVADASGGRVFASVAIAVAVGTGLSLAGAARTVPATLLRGACTLAGVGAGCVAIGLERRLLAPGRWDELTDGLDRGFAALGSAQWPYDGSEPWAALVLLLAIPVTLTAAAVSAFWSKRETSGSEIRKPANIARFVQSLMAFFAAAGISSSTSRPASGVKRTRLSRCWSISYLVM